jgi:hypothetical protein
MHQIQTSKLPRNSSSRSTVAVNPDLLDALRELADREGYTVNGLVALLINESLDRRLHQDGGV